MSSPNSAAPNTADKPTERRGSQGMYSGLVNQKRNSVDAAAAARRQSFNEMKPQAGFIGQMWHNFTKGGPSTSTK